MSLQWKPAQENMAQRAQMLTGLFEAGLAKGMAAPKLCELAASIASLLPYEPQRILALSDALVDHQPEPASTWYFRAQALQRVGRVEEASQACERGLSLDPDDVNLQMQRSKALVESGRAAEAKDILQRLYARSPGFAAGSYVECLLRLGEAEEAQAVIEQCAARSRLTCELQALRYCCAVQLDDKDAITAFREASPISERADAASATEDDIDAFNRELADAIGSSEAMANNPATATIGGAQEFLSQIIDPALQSRVETMIRENVAQFMREFGHTDHVAAAPDEVRITSWAVRLEQGGHQASHTHPAGWLSGVYYVDVGAGEEDGGGIEFWRPPEELAGGRSPPVETIDPRAGLMLAFPSHVYHRTIPHAGKRQRISIAFDVG